METGTKKELRVLVVEDEPVFVESICNILRGCTLVGKIATARTGPQMIEACRTMQPDLILLDIVIPGFDGLKALEEVRRFCPDCACIIITAHEDFSFAHRAIKLGVMDYLLKPVSKETLLASLQRAAHYLYAHGEGPPAAAAEEEDPLLPPSRQPPPEGPIAFACAYLEQHCTDHRLSLEEVAALVGLSPSHFSRVFKEQTGENFVDYLTRLRLNTAARLLRHTRASIGQIALAVGYADPNYLSRIFHRRTGMTPKEYREKAIKTASSTTKDARGDSPGKANKPS